MKKKEVRDLIFQELALALANTTFRLKRRDDAFVRTIPGGWQMLGVPIVNYNPEFIFSITVCIRLDAVESIVHLFSGSPPEYHSLTMTSITGLEYFTNRSPDYAVTTPEEIKSAFMGLSPIVRDKIIPFCDEHQDIHSLDRGVNRQQPGIDKSQPPWSAVYSVILAHLAGNPDFDNLVVKHRRALQIGPEADHPFNRVVTYLKP